MRHDLRAIGEEDVGESQQTVGGFARLAFPSRGIERVLSMPNDHGGILFLVLK